MSDTTTEQEIMQDSEFTESGNSEDEQENQQSLESGEFSESGNTEEEPDTFPRDYVEKLRDENARYRQRAQQSDDLAARLHTTMVEATGRLADPTDLPFEESHLEDSAALHAAIDTLLETKPHLAARKPHGSIGQGAVTSEANNVDLVGLLRAGT